MTEAEWLACTEPQPMLEFLMGKASTRKARLFGCGYLRQIWQRLENKEASRHAVDLAELFADGKATQQELNYARKTAAAFANYHCCPALAEPVWQAVSTVAKDAYDFFEMTLSETQEKEKPDIVNPVTWKIVQEREAIRLALYVTLLRCLFGNPFRPDTLDSSWLTWNKNTVVNLAQDIYDDRAFDHLPILADALEEAGCTSVDILDHCRNGGVHARGCWAVDLILRKK